MAKVITMRTARLTDRMYYSSYSLSTRYCKGGTFITFRDTSVLESKSKRLPFEFLSQGGVFDRFQNKSVQNLQFNGTIYPVCTIGGSSPEILSPGTSRFWKTYSTPLAFRNGNAGTYYVIEPGHDALWGNLYPGSNYWSYEVTHMFAVGSLGRCAIAGYSVLFFLPSTPGGHCPRVEFNIWGRSGVPSNYLSLDLWRGTLEALHGGLPEATKGAHSMRDWAVDNAEFYLDAIAVCTAFMDADFRHAYDRWIAGGGSSPTKVSRGNFRGIQQTEVDLPKTSRFMPWRFLLSANPTRDELSLHAAEVIEAYNAFDSNAIAYAADLKKAGDTAREILKLAKGFRSPKAWASAWLSLRYGDTLMIQDTKELFESVARELGTRSQFILARRSLTTQTSVEDFNISLKRTSTLVASNESYSDLMTGINNLMRWDIWPTLENTWDMIPLSFVVDWFLPVQDLLGQIDAAVQAPYIKPLTQYIGQKCTLHVRQQTSAYHCQGTIVYYKRQPHPILSDIQPFTVKSDLPSFSVIHAGDALALTTTLRGHR